MLSPRRPWRKPTPLSRQPSPELAVGRGRGRHPGLVRRVHDFARFPPPAEGPIFSGKAHAAAYLGAWGLTAAHLILWLCIAIGLLTSEALVIATSAISFAATCLLVWMV